MPCGVATTRVYGLQFQSDGARQESMERPVERGMLCRFLLRFFAVAVPSRTNIRYISCVAVQDDPMEVEVEVNQGAGFVSRADLVAAL